MRHHDELLGRDLAGHDALAKTRVGFVLEVLEQGADFRFVGFVCFGAILREGSGFDCCGVGEHGRRGHGGGVGEAVVDEADAVITSGLIGALDVDFVILVVALVGRDCEGWHFR